MRKLLKKLALFILVNVACIFPAYSDLMYFWANNEEFAEIDESSIMTVTISWEKNGVLNTDTLTAGRAYKDSSWGRVTPGSSTAATPKDFDHSDVDQKSIVYYIDTGSYSLDKYRDPMYSFLVELDMINGTSYSSEFTESDIWQSSGRWSRDLKDHICAGLDFEPVTVPEPNSLLLVLFGFGLIGLKRKTV